MSDSSVAKIIVNQLGGNTFRLLTGAKDFVTGKDRVTFKIGKNPKKITHVRITLGGNDLYTVQFMKWNGRKAEMNVVKELKSVYNDMLQDVFEENTGLYVTMKRRD